MNEQLWQKDQGCNPVSSSVTDIPELCRVMRPKTGPGDVPKFTRTAVLVGWYPA